MRVGNNRGESDNSWSAKFGEFGNLKSTSADMRNKVGLSGRALRQIESGKNRKNCRRPDSDQNAGDLKDILEKMMKMFERIMEKLISQLGGKQDGKSPVDGDNECPGAQDPVCPPEEEPTPPECTCPPEEVTPPVEEKPVCDKPVEQEPEIDVPAEETPEVQDSTKGDFKSYIKELLNKSTGQKVHEERFQFGIATYLISQKYGDEAATAFREAFKANRVKGQANAGEDATKAALKQLVSDGVLTSEQAEQINGLSFKAAQLDGNENQLYDGRGDTKAKAGINKALNLAWEDLESLVNGDMADWPTRSLDAPSTKVKKEAATASSSISSSSVPTGGGSQEFLWKPESDNERKLVIILPNQFKGLVSSVSVLSPEGREIEEGRSSGYANGNREHFRFNKSGGSYPDNSIVELTLTNGETVRYQIGDSSSRYTK